MKKNLLIFTTQFVILVCLFVSTIFANTPKKILYQPKMPATHLRLNNNDCYEAPPECLLVVEPSKWNSSARTYNIEKVCDDREGQYLYNYAFPLKSQLTERKFLARKFCKGIVTISDMGLPFAKSEHVFVTDSNDGLLLVTKVQQKLQSSIKMLDEAQTVAMQIATGDYPATQLSLMESQYFAVINEIQRILSSASFNHISLFSRASSRYIKIPIHKYGQEDYIVIDLSEVNSSLPIIENLYDFMPEKASLAVQTLKDIKSKFTLMLQQINQIQLKVEAASKQEATITTIDLTGPFFIVHQEKAVSAIKSPSA